MAGEKLTWPIYVAAQARWRKAQIQQQALQIGAVVAAKTFEGSSLLAQREYLSKTHKGAHIAHAMTMVRV